MVSGILKTTDAFSFLLIRLPVGLIFLSEGIQKFVTPEAVGAGRFAKIGFDNPEFWSQFVGVTEIVCGSFILLGCITRLAAIPLLIIMAVAFVKTKYPTLLEKGFWTMAHEYRTDFSMTMLLLFLLFYGAGKYSLDQSLYERR